jgi:hypothetical protein
MRTPRYLKAAIFGKVVPAIGSGQWRREVEGEVEIAKPEFLNAMAAFMRKFHEARRKVTLEVREEQLRFIGELSAKLGQVGVQEPAAASLIIRRSMTS